MFRGWTDARTYALTDKWTFETGFIRLTLSKSRPKNDPLTIIHSCSTRKGTLHNEYHLAFL